MRAALSLVGARLSRGVDRAALLAARFARPARGFVLQPEPRSTGQAARGLQMLAGNYLVNGEIVEHGALPPWDLEAPPDLLADLHGFAWLDDLAIVDTLAAREAAQDWVFDWIDRYGAGAGPGWRPDVTGRRMIRWIHHAILILSHRPAEESRAFFGSLGRQARYLALRWRSVPAGLPRFEALAGLVYAALALEGLEHLLPRALKALGRECRRAVAGDGGIGSRSPEELAEVFTLLAWVNLAVSDSGRAAEVHLLRALERMAPAVRALRLGDGRLARFHGGDGGQSERIDHALADAGVRAPARPQGAMGFARLSSGGTLVLMDAAPPPPPALGARAQASTLGFEMSSGRHPLLVGAGVAAQFGPEAARRARTSAAHNTLVIERRSSARFITEGLVGRAFGQRLVEGPRRVPVGWDRNDFGVGVQASHDGYRDLMGLVHMRQLALLDAGTSLVGLDRIGTGSEQDRRQLDLFMAEQELDSIGFELHFRAHPAVEVSVDLAGASASFVLPGGETWILRCPAGLMRLHEAAFFERGRLRPRATQEVVVSCAMEGYETEVTWSLTRAG